jgi:hypothetical protein
MPRHPVAYDDDFFAWTQEQARLLRAGDLADIDVENLADEIESAGRSDRQEIRNSLTVLLANLLTWNFQPRQRGASWTDTIAEERLQIDSVLADSPSLQPFFTEILAESYGCARSEVARETRMEVSTFPPECPYTLEQILSEDFLPE